MFDMYGKLLVPEGATPKEPSYMVQESVLDISEMMGIDGLLGSCMDTDDICIEECQWISSLQCLEHNVS
eukprot:4871069-Karenia_brevis.AAC.1